MPQLVSIDHDYGFNRPILTIEYPSMTYILGSRCKNGVVLVGDKKVVNVNGGIEYEYRDKLFSVIDNLIIGYSGSRRIFELFRNDLVDYVLSNKDNNVYPTITKIRSQISEIMHNLYNRYHRDGIDLLIGVSGEISLDSHAQLTYFHYDGAMEHVTDYKVIGTGAPYGSIFLKQNWKIDMTIYETSC